MIKNTCPKAGTFSVGAAAAADTRLPTAAATEALAAGATAAAVAARTIADARPRPILVLMGEIRLPAGDVRPSATVSLSELEASSMLPISSRPSRGIPLRRIVIGGWGAGAGVAAAVGGRGRLSTPAES